MKRRTRELTLKPYFLLSLEISHFRWNQKDFCFFKCQNIKNISSVTAKNSKIIKRQLDIRGTNFPENLVGHWNAMMLYYDVGEEPEFIHKAIYSQLCPIKTP